MAEDSGGRRLARPTDVRDLFMAAGIDVTDPDDRERFSEVWRWVELRHKTRQDRHKVIKVIGSGACVAIFSALATPLISWAMTSWHH